MRVLLVNAPSRSRVYGALSDLAAIEIPVWAGILASYLEVKGYEVEILDCEAEGWTIETSAKEINSRQPDLAVFTVYGQQPSASTQCLPAAEAVAKECNCRTIAIGTHPSALPAKTLLEGPWTYVCQGEGPLTILGLLHVLEGMGDLKEVPGLWWRNGREFMGNKSAGNIETLDLTLPSRGFKYFDFKKYRAHNWHTFGRSRTPYASLQTSLGCPWRCTFCCINAPFGNSGIRFWSAKNVLSHFEELGKQGVENVKIPDEMFVLNPLHVNAICDGLISMGTYFNIWAYARVDTIKDDKLLAKMRTAGFRWLGVGIESASKHVRDGVEKGRFGNADVIQNVRRVQKHGIYVGANYIFGLPDENHFSMQETLDLALELNTEWANFYCAMAYPGSGLYLEAKKKGWRLPEDGPGWIGYSQHSYETLPLPTDHLRPEQVLTFRDNAFHIYFNRPEYHDLINHHFGKEAVDEVRKMAAHRIQRKHWIEGLHEI